ncbi:hypothetical protein [Rugamonas sp. DEMB1]|uniref:hypothetical protein n=1 Tax=Rugamonas sp. DEMB1 TaxID=3039386 RepID=UPI0028BDB80B|nr:hypothetical protein [Rugamonas sp. DEMB1]
MKLLTALHAWCTPGFREARSGAVRPDDDDELPLRAELFSAAQMAAHGKTLAGQHSLSRPSFAGRRDRLLARLAENAELIGATCVELTAAVTAGRQVTPASEWLLDNYYLIEEQIRTARRHLPKGYSRQLPRLAGAGVEGCPRAYKLALEIISHGDGRVDPESLRRFVDAYQEGAALELGELWAIPIMLRLALIENLRRVAARVADNRRERDLAADWAERMGEVAEHNASGLILLVADMARSEPPVTSAFVAELARRLQGQSQALTLALSWLGHRLAEAGLTIEQQIQSEIQQQAAEQVSISNSIGSLRVLGSMDWQEFVESMSVVERELRQARPRCIHGWTSPPATSTATSSSGWRGAAGTARPRWPPWRCSWRGCRPAASTRATATSATTWSAPASACWRASCACAWRRGRRCRRAPAPRRWPATWARPACWRWPWRRRCWRAPPPTAPAARRWPRWRCWRCRPAPSWRWRWSTGAPPC